MFKEANFTPANYTAQTLTVLGDIPAQKMTFDIIAHNGHDALVVDASGVDVSRIESWVTELKHTATRGAIYAYDHSVDGEVKTGMPEISLMFEGVKSIEDVNNLINQFNAEIPTMVKTALNEFKSEEFEKEDTFNEQAQLAASAKLLSVAHAF